MSSPLLRPQILEALDMGINQARPVRNICCVGAGYVGKREGTCDSSIPTATC